MYKCTYYNTYFCEISHYMLFIILITVICLCSSSIHKSCVCYILILSFKILTTGQNFIRYLKVQFIILGFTLKATKFKVLKHVQCANAPPPLHLQYNNMMCCLYVLLIHNIYI